MKTKIATICHSVLKWNLFLLILIFFLTGSCSESMKEPFYVLKIKGNGAVFNYSRSIFGYMLYADSTHSTAIMVKPGDLLFFGDEENIYYVDTLKNSAEVSFSCKKPFGCVNGFINSITIDKDIDLLPWFKNMKASDVSHLQSLLIDSDIPVVYMPYLKEIAKTKPDISLFVDEEHAAQAKELLNIFKPVFLKGMMISENDVRSYPNLKFVKLLITAENDTTVSTPLPYLPGLKQLFINEEKHKIAGNYLSKNPQIERLVCVGKNDMTFTRDVKDLKELCLINFKNGEDTINLDFVQNLKKLEVLCLSGERFRKFDAIGKMQRLEWLSLLTNTRQQEFNSILDRQKGLKVLEVLSDTSLNMQPVSDLQHLQGLVIVKNAKVEPFLFSMKKLKYLSVSDRIFENDLVNVNKLKQSLPNCTIVPNNGFCLGSGWLFLLIPLTLVFGIGFRFRHKRLTE